VTVPIALAGIEAAHALANVAFGAPERHGELFASAASGGELVPLLAAAAGALVLLGLGGRVAGSWSLPRGAPPLAFPFAALPPLAFVLLEASEGLLHRGTVPWGEALEPTFLVGLALQLPFALAGYLVARLLLRLSDDVRTLLERRRRAWPSAQPRVVVPAVDEDHRPRPSRGSAHLGRAPPPALVTSG
jgi:hypothetical protein